MFAHRLFLIGLFLMECVVVHADTREAFAGVDRKWRHYQSPNFELYSAQGDSASRKVLESMELLRAVFLDTFKLTVRQPQPVTIYYFDRQKDFEAYVPPRLLGGDTKWAGFCTNFADRTVITLAPPRDGEFSPETVYHEYIHYLFRIVELNPVPWFEEGVAELFSTMKVSKKFVELGHPVPGRVRDLQLKKTMPFEQLFAVRRDSPVFMNSNHTGVFYAQSWAFVHYLRHGQNKIPEDKVATFLRIAVSPRIQERHEEFRVACEQLLDLDYAEMNRVIERYVSTGRYQFMGFARPAIAPPSSYISRQAEPNEITARLAELALRQSQNAYANWFVRDLLDREPSIRLRELIGTIALNEGQDEVAREHWNKALEMGTTNVAIFRELGRLESNLVFNSFNLDYEMPVERAERLRQLLKRSIECAPGQSQGYEMLAWVEASVRKPNIANVNLIQQRIPTLNDKARTVLALSIVRLRREDKEDALKLLDQLQMLEPSEWVVYCAEITRARIEERPIDLEKLPKANPGQPGGSIRLPGTLELPR